MLLFITFTSVSQIMRISP